MAKKLYFLFNPGLFMANFTPLAPLGFGGMGSALVLIFWAYVGFELVTVPADEIKDAKKTIPLALGIGMGVITVFYMVTNFLVVGSVNWQILSQSSAPLAQAYA